MAARLPFWMHQRQVKAEEVNAETLRLVAPVLPVHELTVTQDSPEAGWKAALHRVPPEGDKVLVAETQSAFPNVTSAWQAGYELFRQTVVI